MGERKPTRLGDVISIKHGYAFRGEYFSDDAPGPLLLTPGNFAIGGGFKSGKPKHYVGPVPDEFRLAAGDLVITMTDLSKSGDTLGFPAIIPSEPEYLHNQRTGLVTIKVPGKLDKKFLYYALRTNDYRQYILSGATGSTVRHTSPSRISGYDFSAPNFLDQQAIAAVLWALDDKIASNHRIARTSFELAECCYERLAMRATSAMSFGDIADLKYGKALPASYRVSGDVPVYGSGGITGSHNQALVTGRGVIVGRKGTVGSLYWSEEDFFPIDTTFYVEAKRAAMPMEFIYFTLRSLGLQSMNSDSAVPGLNRGNVLALPVRLPVDEDVRTFHGKVRPIFALRCALSTESAALARLRDALLPKLMSGEIGIRDAEKIVEDAT
jgi:type I restriction enzyme, S subunit